MKNYKVDLANLLNTLIKQGNVVLSQLTWKSVAIIAGFIDSTNIKLSRTYPAPVSVQNSKLNPGSISKQGAVIDKIDLPVFISIAFITSASSSTGA